MFVAEAVDVFPVRLSGERVVAGGDGLLVDCVGVIWVGDLRFGGPLVSTGIPGDNRSNQTHPEINLHIPRTPPELPVSDLECHCHLVVSVQLFVEAFSRVCVHLDVVGNCNP